MDKKTLEFVTYCIGKLSVMLKLPQKEIYKRLKTSGILDEYIIPSYDVLHTFSSRYLMEDLTGYMREKGVLPAGNYIIRQMYALNILIRKHSRSYLDFGRGFYLTSLHEQAIRYAQRFKRRGQAAWLNTYDFVCDEKLWKIKHFDSYDKEWLDFVAQCREGIDSSDHDMIIGGIANDRVIITLDRYFSGEISQEEALGLLKFEKPNIQYCIRTNRMLQECLKYIGSEQIGVKKANKYGEVPNVQELLSA